MNEILIQIQQWFINNAVTLTTAATFIGTVICTCVKIYNKFKTSVDDLSNNKQLKNISDKVDNIENEILKMRGKKK